MAHLHHRRPRREPRQGAGAGLPAPPVGLDLLRADLYRLLDELARARHERHGALVQEFERAWEVFREATAGRR